MAIEAYIPSQVSFNSRPIGEVVVITLHDLTGPSPFGSMTTSQPLVSGAMGELSFVGRRDGKEWKVTLSRVQVRNRTALGCEYAIIGPVHCDMLRDLGESAGPHKKALEERFDIR